MCNRSPRIILLLSALVLLTTCQLQFNKSTGDNVSLQVVVPGDASGGGRSVSGSKSIAGGTSLMVTITPPQGPNQILSESIAGKSSRDFSFNISSSGLYQVTAQMLDGSGGLLSTVSAQLKVPAGSYPVVLRMPSNLLNAVLTGRLFTGGPVTYAFVPLFGPTIYNYSNVVPSIQVTPVTLMLTTVDPNATITSVTETGVNSNGMPFTVVDTPIGTTYTLSLQGVPTTTVTIVVTAVDGGAVTYTMVL